MVENITQKLIKELGKLKGNKEQTAHFIQLIKKAKRPVPDIESAIYLFFVHIAKNPELRKRNSSNSTHNRKIADQLPEVFGLPETPTPENRNARKK